VKSSCLPQPKTFKTITQGRSQSGLKSQERTGQNKAKKVRQKAVEWAAKCHTGTTD